MKKLGLLLGIFLMTMLCYGQQGEVLDEVLIKAPRYIGSLEGIEAISPDQAPIDQYLFNYLQNQVDFDNAEYQEGTVIVDFTVRKDGTIDDIEIKNSVSYSNDNAVIAGIMETDGNWKPGSKDGEPVEMKKRVVIAFNNPETPSLRQKATAYFRQGVKRYYKAESFKNEYFVPMARMEKKSDRKLNAAIRSFDMASVFVPYDVSTLFWKVKTYEKLGDFKNQYECQEQLNELLTFDMMDISISLVSIVL